MRTLATLTLTMILSGCFGAGVDPAASRPLCDGTAEDRTAHAAALAADGGPLSRATGRVLIARIDAGCGEEG